MKIIRELQYILECLNGFIHGLKMPFKRCCMCGEWSSDSWYKFADGKIWCSCKNDKWKVEKLEKRMMYILDDND